VHGPVRMALTGSPGVGKTTLSSLLEERGIEVVSVESIAERLDCIDVFDPSDGARPIDIDELCSLLEEDWSEKPDASLVIEGHLSHLLPVDCSIVLRCDPSVLRARLEKRGYSDWKITQNVEWEIIGGPWSEIVEDIPLLEVDTTSGSASSRIDSIMRWISDGFKPRSPTNPIDWIEREGS